jgi:hypothetical protein
MIDQISDAKLNKSAFSHVLLMQNVLKFEIIQKER